MGITIDFLIKHVRPINHDALNFLQSNGELNNALEHLRLTEEQIKQVLAKWELVVINGQDGANPQVYLDAAIDTTNDRWTELYKTSISTILFLTAEQIAELSHDAAKHPNNNFNFKPGQEMLAVHVNKPPATSELLPNVFSAQLAADAQGNVVHLASINRE